MNLQYLGDALDHWKGSVFERLQESGYLEKFKVDAMASDAEQWDPSDWELFSSLLRVTPDQIVEHKTSLKGKRVDYFNEAPNNGDLFFDPDTGILTGKVTDINKYLKPSELSASLEADKNRIIIVYQHVRAQRTRDRVENVLAALRAIRDTFFCLSYESGTVAMLFFSLDRMRMISLEKYFRQFLGNHADHRIGCWL